MKTKKNKILSLVIVVFVLILLGTIRTLKLNKNVKNIYANETSINTLSIMLETDAGSGEYNLEKRSSWPTKEDGYTFNSELSKCENGSKLKWNEEINAIIFSGSMSDRCYVYFDVYVPPMLIADYVKNQYTGTQGDNNIYYHDGTITDDDGNVLDAQDYSYRYAGANEEVNNYVCFGSDAATCPDDNLYRIIGVFGDQVKLIKYDYASVDLLGTNGDYVGKYRYDSSNYKGDANNLNYIGGYAWNGDNNNTIDDKDGSNIWNTSSLNKTNLNKFYLKNIQSDLVSTTTWKVGGNEQDKIINVVPNNLYQNEIINPVENTYDAKIGLMYASDYAFAANSSSWNVELGSYSRVVDNNWMYMGLYEWVISPRDDKSNYHNAFYISNDGHIGDYCSVYGYAVRPAFYLNSSVNYVSGDGTKTSPIRIN